MAQSNDAEHHGDQSPAEAEATSPVRERLPRFSRATPSGRVMAGVIALLCLSVLAAGAWMQPDAAGHGTHTQLGLPSCSWAAVLDRPCPTCGMTTAVAYASDGAFVSSFLAQPFGFLLAMGASVIFWGALHVATTGSRIGSFMAKLLGTRFLVVIGLLALASWAYKFITWNPT